jgi:hypothetical protein
MCVETCGLPPLPGNRQGWDAWISAPPFRKGYGTQVQRAQRVSPGPLRVLLPSPWELRFPVELVGINAPHAAFREESRIRERV